MGGITSEIVLGVISNGIWAGGGVAGVLAARPVIRYLSTKRPLRNLIVRNRRRSVIIIQSAVRNRDQTEYFKYLVTPDCVTGYYHLHERLLEVGYRPDEIFVRFPGELTPDGLAQSDLVLIGGYENNQISADLNSEDQQVYLKDNKINVKGRAVPYDVFVQDGKVKKDYCIISRRPNSFSNGGSGDCWIIAFEGIRHYGTEAGIKFVTAKNFRNGLFGKIRKAKEVYIIVSCGVTHVTDSSYSLRNITVEYVWIDGKCLLNRGD